MTAPTANLGTKATNLLRLRDEFGLLVPPFVALPFADLIDDFPATRSALQDAVTGYLTSNLEVAELEPLLTELLVKVRWSQSGIDEAWSRLQTKNWRKVSYRTSAAAEDLAGASFAGQYESFLDQDLSPQSLAEHAHKCFSSMLSARVLSYAKSQGITAFELGGALIVQEMFYGERSGVLFSENGQGALSVVFAEGWQNTVVEGQSAGEFVVPRQTLASAQLPPEVKELCVLALQIEARVGHPVDVEWSYRSGQLMLLQFRPQTVATVEYILEWDSTNISENYPGITLPLTYSYIRQLYAGVYPAFFRLLGTNPKALAAESAAFENMLGYVNGRVYYRISNWYTVLKLLPGKSNQEFFEAMLNPVKKRGTDATKRRTDLASAFAIARFLLLLLRSEKLSVKFRNRLVAQLELTSSYQLDFINAAAVLDALKRGRVEMLNQWAVPILNDVKLMVFHGVLKRFFSQENPEEYLNFLKGLTDRASIKPLEGLAELGSLVESTMTRVGAKSIDALKATQEWPKVLSAANRYVVEFGARTPDELKLENQRLTESLDSVLELALKATSVNLEKPRTNQTNWPAHVPTWQRGALSYVANQTRKAIDWRERFRFNRAQFFNVARDAFDAIGKALAAEGIIDAPRDIYWLTEFEVDELVNGHGWSLEVRETVAARKAQYEEYEVMDSSLAVQGAGRIAAKHLIPVQAASQSSNGSELSGNGVAPGTLTAEIVVATSFDPALDVRGKILVVHHIDPGWTLLFTQAAGIVAERGNALSHAAIIAREIGIPAVVAVPGATKELTTGLVVSINGTTGSIHRGTN